MFVYKIIVGLVCVFLYYLPLLPGQEFLHLVLGEGFGGAVGVVYTQVCHPRMR